MRKKLIILFTIMMILYAANEGSAYEEFFHNNLLNNRKDISKIIAAKKANNINIESALKILKENNNKCTYKLFTETSKLPKFIKENFYSFQVIEDDIEYDSLYCVHKSTGSIYQCWPNGKYKKIK